MPSVAQEQPGERGDKGVKRRRKKVLDIPKQVPAMPGEVFNERKRWRDRRSGGGGPLGVVGGDHWSGGGGPLGVVGGTTGSGGEGQVGVVERTTSRCEIPALGIGGPACRAVAGPCRSGQAGLRKRAGAGTAAPGGSGRQGPPPPMSEMPIRSGSDSTDSSSGRQQVPRRYRRYLISFRFGQHGQHLSGLRCVDPIGWASPPRSSCRRSQDPGGPKQATWAGSSRRRKTGLTSSTATRETGISFVEKFDSPAA